MCLQLTYISNIGISPIPFNGSKEITNQQMDLFIIPFENVFPTHVLFFRIFNCVTHKGFIFSFLKYEYNYSRQGSMVSFYHIKIIKGNANGSICYYDKLINFSCQSFR